MEKVKLGIIGCGIAAQSLHWPALQKLKDEFEITIICNHTEKKAQDFSKLLGGVPYVLSYNKIINRDRHLFICHPPCKGVKGDKGTGYLPLPA